MKHTILWGVVFTAIFASWGCSKRTPSIAHVHIGHAMTGWHNTPDKEGLFVVAQKKAGEALKYAGKTIDGNQNIKTIKTNTDRVTELTDGEVNPSDDKKRYGVKQALTGAVSHITYAATSPDASQNVKSFADVFAKNATGVLDRCDLITALGNDIKGSKSPEEAGLLAREVEKLVRANIRGEDLNGDGRIGSEPEEFGLVQLHRDIENMIAREDPPYTTVASWYLFNLIRLPDGRWIFRNRSKSSGDPYGDGTGSY